MSGDSRAANTTRDTRPRPAEQTRAVVITAVTFLLLLNRNRESIVDACSAEERLFFFTSAVSPQCVATRRR